MLEDMRLPATFDAHVHLRSGTIMEAVVPTIRQGGANMVYVMPNLVPPVTSVAMAIEYRRKLQALEPDVTFLMSLFLCSEVTPEVIVEAKKAGIRGVKSYPAGVTTNSAAGVLDYKVFYPTLAAMERENMILNLHGECPSSGNISILNAEEKFLPTLHMLHNDFPKLRIILEHCTSEAAISAVKLCGENIAGTITAHHLFLTVNDWAGDSTGLSWCKPAAKTPQDRVALLRAAASNNPKFFFGSDSAPHPISAKRGIEGKPQAAGIFTQPCCSQLVVDAFVRGCDEGLLGFERLDEKRLAGFLSEFGRSFYQEPTSNESIIITTTQPVQIPELITANDPTVAIAPFRGGQHTRNLRWV